MIKKTLTMRGLIILILAVNFVFAQNVSKLPNDLGKRNLMTINGDSVSIEDFWYVFNKNNFNEVIPSDSDIVSYVELYKKFKLKVEEAKALKLDQTPEFKSEFEGYKNQLAESYLVDKAVTEDLIKEAYERSKYEVKASHILINIPYHSAPSDTMNAYKKILEIRKKALAGADFDSLAVEYSDDPSVARNYGDLGYFSVFQMVYPFESGAYNTEVGEVSKIVRTRFGYHILKVKDKRDVQGRIKVAHIMIIDPEHDHSEANHSHDHNHGLKEQKIREIYSKLESGEESFEVLAKKYSEHMGSAKYGGELPWFSGNKYDPTFVQIAYDLKENGSYSKPFKSKYGWHIVKKIDYEEFKSFEESKKSLNQKVSKGDRANLSKEAVLKRIKKEYNFIEYPKNFEVFYKITDSTLIEGTWESPKKPKLKKKLFVLNGKKYIQKDFANYLEKNITKKTGGDHRQLVKYTYDTWVDELLVNLEKSMLSTKYPQYKRLLEEYKDGIILFELTDEVVWSKAIKDTTGLKNYFEKNKNNYKYEPRIKGERYVAATLENAERVKNLLEENKTMVEIIAELNKGTQLNITSEKAIFSKKSSPELKDVTFEIGITEVIKIDEKYYVYKIEEVLAPSVKPLNEIKGVVTADYQELLMNSWLEELSAKYDIVVDQKAIDSLIAYVNSLK